MTEPNPDSPTPDGANASHDPFFRLIENAPFGVVVVDAQLRVLRANTASLKAFSNVHPLIGRRLEEVLRAISTERSASEVLARFGHTLQTGEPHTDVDATELRKDAAAAGYCEWETQRVTLADGQFGVAGYFREVTERKLAEDVLRDRDAFTRSILKSSPDCIKVLDLEGNLLSMQSGQELLGIEDIRPFLNTSWISFWEGEHRLAARAAIARATVGELGNFVGFFRTLRGEPKWWDVTISPIHAVDGRPMRLLAVSRDVTRRRQAEMNFEFLASVSRELADWSSVDAMMQTAGAKISAYLELSICAFAQIDEKAEQVAIDHDWHRPDVPSLLGVYRLADFVGDEFIRLARAGEVIVVRNAATDARTNAEQFAALNIESFLCVPLIREGEWRFAMCLYKSSAHDWRQDEIELARELTARIWTRLERLRAEAALRESERRYRTLFESMDEGYCIIDMIFDEDERPVDWRFVEVNPAFSKLTGVHDAVGKRMRELAPDHESYWFETYGKVALTGEPIRFVNAAKALDDRWFDLFAFKVPGPGSRRVAVLFNNITERKQTEKALRRSEERFRALFDSGPIAMYCVDATGTIQEFNRNAAALWGREPQRGDRDEQPAVAAVLEGGIPAAHDLPVFMQRPDGSQMALIANVVALRDGDGKITGAMTSLYDITERSRLERETRKQAETLVDLDRRKDEFLAMLSHELRNPLAPISNALHLMRLQENEAPLQQKARIIIERQVGQLNRLVGELLEISRITTGRIQLRQERIVVSGVVERAVESVQSLVAQHRHELTVALAPQTLWLYADAARLEQVLVNLLTNAAKYTADGGRIRLTVQQEGDMAVLRVQDTGIGIEPVLLPRIFDLFTQAKRSLDRSQGGLGIGLCLVQRLVELHGGTVGASSILGQGSEFVVRLPLMPLAAPAAASPSSSAAFSMETCCRILVVDDNVDAAESLAMLLESSGHEIRMAHDGPSALVAALDYRPDLMLLDIGLPGLTGLQVAERIRREPTLEPIMLVAVTGYGQESDRQRSRDAGFDHHLAKPVDFDTLQAILATVATVTLEKRVH